MSILFITNHWINGSMSGPPWFGNNIIPEHKREIDKLDKTHLGDYLVIVIVNSCTKLF